MIGQYRANWAAPYLCGETTAFTIYGVWKLNGPPSGYGIYANKNIPGNPGLFVARNAGGQKPIYMTRLGDSGQSKVVQTLGLGGIQHQTGADFAGIPQTVLFDKLAIDAWKLHVEWKIWSGALSDVEIANLIAYSTDRYGAI